MVEVFFKLELVYILKSTGNQFSQRTKQLLAYNDLMKLKQCYNVRCKLESIDTQCIPIYISTLFRHLKYMPFASRHNSCFQIYLFFRPSQRLGSAGHDQQKLVTDQRALVSYMSGDLWILTNFGKICSYPPFPFILAITIYCDLAPFGPR